MPDQLTYRSQILDHLGLVAGTFEEFGIGDVLDQATHQNPELRDLTVGEAVKQWCAKAWDLSTKRSTSCHASFRTSTPPDSLHPAWLPSSSTMTPLAGPWRPSTPMG
jgi:hypothetical protein